VPDPSALPRTPTRRAIAVLAITQLIGWGTTFFSPAVLSNAVMRDIGIDREIVFAGVGVMLAIGGALGPFAGRTMDRIGARPLMALGSLLGAGATTILAFSQGPLSWLAGWVLVGAMLPLALGTAAFAALAQLSAEGSRRAITTLTLFSGLSATLFWPITGWLEGLVGWRSTYLVFAALNLCVCLPLHWFVLPKRQRTPVDEAPRLETGELPPERRRAAFLAFALATSAQGFVGWGLSLHLPHLLESLGLAAATALVIAALGGPAQIAGRGIDMIAAGKIHPLGLALLSVSLAPLAFLLLVRFGGSLGTAIAFILLLSACNGLMTVCRATVPLALYGRAGYGALLGRLSLPQNLMFASSPVVFAWAMSAGGPTMTLMLALGTTVIALGAMLLLARIAQVPLIARGSRSPS
jgi:predicted MFS family arabinose efflux permease